MAAPSRSRNAWSEASSSRRSGPTEPSRRDRVVLGHGPDLGVDLGEHVLRRGVPGPPQVAGEVSEARQGRGQDRTDRESSDGTHGRTVAENDWIVPIQPRPRHQDVTRAGGISGVSGSARLACAMTIPEGWRAWSVASPSWTSCRWSTSVVCPAKAHGGRGRARPRDRLPRGARPARRRGRAWSRPTGRAARRCGWSPRATRPTATSPGSSPTSTGAWTFEVHAWSDPLATWEHDAGLKIPAGRRRRADVPAGVAAVRPGRRRPRPRQPCGDRWSAAPPRPPATRRRPVEARLAALQSPELDGSPGCPPAARAGHRRGPLPAATPTGSGRCSAAGTSSSRGRRARRTTRRPAAWSAAPSAPPPSGSTRSPRWASTSSTCRRSTRSARSTARAPTTPSTPARTTPARRGRSAARRAATTRSTPTSARSPTSTRSWRRPPRLGLEVALDLALQCAPDHPWVTSASRVVHHAGRRHDRLRREPAEEVPGHLPAQLRQRPAGHLPRGAAHRAALDGARRPDLPGRQPAHQAGRRSGSGCCARCAVPTPT